MYRTRCSGGRCKPVSLSQALTVNLITVGIFHFVAVVHILWSFYETVNLVTLRLLWNVSVVQCSGTLFVVACFSVLRPRYKRLVNDIFPADSSVSIMFSICLAVFVMTSRVNSLSVALRAGYLSVRTAEGASEKQSSLKARLRNGLTYLLTYLEIVTVIAVVFFFLTMVSL